jgi:hypothetical protein
MDDWFGPRNPTTSLAGKEAIAPFGAINPPDLQNRDFYSFFFK